MRTEIVYEADIFAAMAKGFAADLRGSDADQGLPKKDLFRDYEFVSMSHPRIIRPPVRDSFLDVGAAQLFIERALEKSGEFRVGSKAQPDDLRIG